MYPEPNNINQQIELNDNIIFNFDEEIVTKGNIVILDISNSMSITPTIEISGNDVLISSDNLDFSMEYKILADTFNFTDLSDIPIVDTNGILSNYKFYTLSIHF